MSCSIHFAFFLTLLAGLSTGIGSLISIVTPSTDKRFLSISLSFSAGVMIYVSMVEILFKAQNSLSEGFGEKTAHLIAVIAFFGGMFLIALIDMLIPSVDNSQKTNSPCFICSEAYSKVSEKDLTSSPESLLRMGFFTALSIGIHNFPEGLATFVSALQDPGVAIPIVIAIAIHNIPEGIAVSVPIYFATASKKKAFFYSLASGFAEPIGALAGWLLLMPIMSSAVFGIVFSSVSGIMVFISFDELLPTAQKYGDHRLSMCGLVFGMIIMAFSLHLFL